MSCGRSRVIFVRGERAPSGPDAIAALFQAPAALFQVPVVNLDSENFADPPVSPASTWRARSSAKP
jgi:hypothetical protein